MVYIGIDVGGTGVQVGVVNEQGEIIAKDSFPTGVGRPYQEMIRDMADCTRSGRTDDGRCEGRRRGHSGHWRQQDR